MAAVKYDTQPDRSSLWRESIVVGSLHASRVNEASQLIQNQRMDNRSTTWKGDGSAFCVAESRAYEFAALGDGEASENAAALAVVSWHAGVLR